MTTLLTRHRSVHITCWVLILLAGALQAWTYRLDLSSEDSVSYLDLSDVWTRGDLSHVANGYWGQLYPAAIGATRVLLGQPSQEREFALLKGVNLGFCAAALGAFAFLLHRLLRFHARLRPDATGDGSTLATSNWATVAAAYVVFAWTALRWTGTFADTPDLCVAALTYLAAGLVLGLHERTSLREFALLGAVLGLGYASKAVMLPVGVAFLGAASYWATPRRSALGGVALAASLFVLVSAPQVVAYSSAAHRLSLGDSGRLNYIWYVNPRVPDHLWQTSSADPAGPRLPHPVRQISTDPPAFEFAGPVAGTYPPWYDPSYWYDGFQIPFNWTAQARAIYRNTRYYFLTFAGAILGWLVLVAAGERDSAAVRRVVRHPLALPAAAGLGLYAVGTDLSALPARDMRLVAPFVALACTVLFSSIPPDATATARRVRMALFGGLVLLLGANLIDPSIRFFPRPSDAVPSEHAKVARGLHDAGVCAGDAVAHLGMRGYYWARLARVRIVAEVPDAARFWASDKPARDEVIRALQATGVAAVVQRPGARNREVTVEPGWQKLAGTNCYVYLFQARAGGCRPE